jgi:hypothetical protein
MLLMGSGCGNSTQAQAPASNAISGGQGCPAAEAQDLTFSGKFVGHLSCSTSAAMCTKGAANAKVSAGLAAAIDARVEATAVQLLIVFFDTKPGIYPGGRLGDEPTSTSEGATLDGPGVGHWETHDGAGPMTLSVYDSASASGSLNVILSSGTETLRVSGTWRCVKPPGF